MNPKKVIPILILILASSIQAQENASAPEQQHADMMKRRRYGDGILTGDDNSQLLPSLRWRSDPSEC